MPVDDNEVLSFVVWGRVHKGLQQDPDAQAQGKGLEEMVLVRNEFGPMRFFAYLVRS